jgi:hypothetical protein
MQPPQAADQRGLLGGDLPLGFIDVFRTWWDPRCARRLAPAQQSSARERLGDVCDGDKQTAVEMFDAAVGDCEVADEPTERPSDQGVIGQRCVERTLNVA